jgi:hypothetical protein
MKDDWIRNCLRLSRMEADLWSGCRKIMQGVSLTFDINKPNVTLADAGYTKYKMTLLLKLYKHQESIDAAKVLWDRRKKQAKYGSVGFHCYGHLIKGQRSGTEEIEGKSSRSSVMGPCIQAVNITYIRKGEATVDVFYRTTELFKKFPADLVMLKDYLLSEFDFTDLRITNVRMHFANVTLHPMYFVTLLPSIADPIAELERIKKVDRRFYDWIVKWTARYVIEEYHRGIAKFGQAQRVKKDALSRIKGADLKKFQKYLKDNHPGHRNDYVAPEELEEDVDD